MAAKSASSPPYKDNSHLYHANLFDEPAKAVPITHQTVATPVATDYTAAFEPAPPAPTKAELWTLTVILVPFHSLNFILSTIAFCVEVTGVCLAIGLLPLCCLGIPVYYGTLHVTRVLAIADVALANMITPYHAAVRLDERDAESEQSHYGLCIAPDLTRVSLRSSLVVLYFTTIKFALAILGAVAVSLPFLPISSQISASLSPADEPKYVAGWNVHNFNFSTHPVWYTLTCIGYIVGGIVLMHLFGVASRETTRFVCCVQPTRRTTAGAPV